MQMQMLTANNNKKGAKYLKDYAMMSNKQQHLIGGRSSSLNALYVPMLKCVLSTHSTADRLLRLIVPWEQKM